MATRKRTTRRSGSIVGRAVSAGRRALREAESRVPPDLRRQVDRRLKDADKTARAAIKQLQAQVKKASTRADVNTVLKRIDELTRQARQIARGTRTRAASTRRTATRRTATRRAATTTRRATTRKAASSTRRKPAASKPAASTRRAAPGRAPAARATTARTAARRATPRRRARPTEPESSMAEIIETVIPVDEGEIDVIEITES